jgi:hypothetical protein
VIVTENSKSMKETLQLDDSIQKEKLNMHNESFGLDLSNLNNLTSLNDNSINEFQKLDMVQDDTHKAYSSKKSDNKIELNGKN